MAKNKIPSKQECLSILNKNNTPSNVIEHCRTVCKIAEAVADKLIKEGILVNKELVIAGALLHDIERAKKNHVLEGAKLLKKLGFPEVVEVIRKHSLYNIGNEEVKLKTIEEKIVFYADKRAVENKIVSIEERFKDLEKRYNIDLSREFEFTKKVEKELTQF